jgi:eukaryotic-like serine/threonine-protein kinase
MEWISGDKVNNGKYKIEKILGRGGFAITYKAIHIGLNNFVAIKVPFKKYKEYFDEEIKTISGISEQSHHIVRVRDLFNEEDLPCLVMDFIEGDNLFDLIQSRQTPLLEIEAISIVSQIGEALRIIHKDGIVHRDINPKNIILSKDGRAILIDFGTARKINGSSTYLSSNTPVLTTPENRQQYTKSFAPYEQILGEFDCLPTVDIFSLSATLYYLVTKEFPEPADDRKIYNSFLEPPKTFARISDGLNQSIINGMNLDAKDRPSSIDLWLKSFGKTGDIYCPPQFNPEFEEEYKLLEYFLVNKKWHDADIQTATLMLKIVNREIYGWMGMNDWDLFPCKDLQVIDKLWFNYSQGLFGFSVQRDIWNFSDKNWNKFADAILWINDTVIKPRKYLVWYFNWLTNVRNNQLVRGRLPTVARPITGILVGRVFSEKMRENSIINLSKYIVDYRQSVASEIATLRRSEQQYLRAQSDLNSWRKKSELCLMNGDDNLYKETLLRIKNYSYQSDCLEIEFQHLSTKVEIGSAKLVDLELKKMMIEHGVLLPIEMLVLKLENCNKLP